MNYNIPDSVLHFYQLAKAQGVTLPHDLSIYQQVRLFVARMNPDTPEQWQQLEQSFISAIMAGIPEPVSEDPADMIA